MENVIAEAEKKVKELGEAYDPELDAKYPLYETVRLERLKKAELEVEALKASLEVNKKFFERALLIKPSSDEIEAFTSSILLPSGKVFDSDKVRRLLWNSKIKVYLAKKHWDASPETLKYVRRQLSVDPGTWEAIKRGTS